ncbi:hypothetical protein BDW22DRAFT_880139 [Trametopsis cervina]|nr:hypothetical protein BDW22DRAFT_880139 [Trametopsis cervina]
MHAWSLIPLDDISSQPHLDTNGTSTRFDIMNHGQSGTGLGRADGLLSVRRMFSEYGITSIESPEIAVVSYGKLYPAFSDSSDSGAGVLGHINGPYRGDRCYLCLTFDRIHDPSPDVKIYGVTNPN